MALEPCRECGQEISSEADACPHCGAPGPPQRTERFIKNLFALLILVPVAWFLIAKC